MTAAVAGAAVAAGRGHPGVLVEAPKGLIQLPIAAAAAVVEAAAAHDNDAAAADGDPAAAAAAAGSRDVGVAAVHAAVGVAAAAPAT